MEEELGSLLQKDLEATVNTLPNGLLDFGCGAGAAVEGVPAVVAAPDGIVGVVVVMVLMEVRRMPRPTTGLQTEWHQRIVVWMLVMMLLLLVESSPSSQTNHSTDSTIFTTNIIRGTTSIPLTPSHCHIHTSTSMMTPQAANGSYPHIPNHLPPLPQPRHPAPTILHPHRPSTNNNPTTILTHGLVAQQPPFTEQQILQLRKIMSQYYQITSTHTQSLSSSSPEPSSAHSPK